VASRNLLLAYNLDYECDKKLHMDEIALIHFGFKISDSGKHVFNIAFFHSLTMLTLFLIEHILAFIYMLHKCKRYLSR